MRYGDIRQYSDNTNNDNHYKKLIFDEHDKKDFAKILLRIVTLKLRVVMIIISPNNNNHETK